MYSNVQKAGNGKEKNGGGGIHSFQALPKKTVVEGPLAISFYEASITPILKLDPFMDNSLVVVKGLAYTSIKLRAMPCRATQDGRVIVKSSDKKWSIGGGNGKPLQYSCPETPMNSMKRQKYMILESEPCRFKDEPPG